MLYYPIAMQDTEVFAILSDEGKEHFWPQIAEQASRALPYCYGEMDVEDLYPLMYFGLFSPEGLQLACGVERVQYPKFHTVRIVVLAGKGILWKDWAQQAFEKWARDDGAKYVEGVARPAMVRFWRRVGGFPAYTVVRKEL